MKILVVGDFGHIHAGHLDHIRKAYGMGDWLIIATHKDESIKERKGYDPDPLWARMFILKAILHELGGKGEVVMAEDTDGDCVKTLEYYKPSIYAKGGGYNIYNMPRHQVELCEKLGIEIVYGVGERLNQSRDISHVNK